MSRVDSWPRSTVGEIFALVGGGTPSTERESYWGGRVPWVSSADIDQDFGLHPRRTVSDEGLANSPASAVPIESVIVVTRVGLGKVGLVKQAPICFSQDCHALLPVDGIDPRFTAYQLKWSALSFLGQSRGTTINGITKKQLSSTPFLVPPSNEQCRLADALDELFSDLDAGVAALERARERLKLYRVSVLKAAVEGELTAEWRGDHPYTEPAAELLSRIRAERRQRWEEDQLAKFKLKQQELPKDWRAKYKEPVAPDTTNLPGLPAGWCWATTTVCFFIIDYRGRTPPFCESGVPHLRSTNIKGGRIVWENLTYVSEQTFDRYMTRGLPRKGDILFTTEAPLGEAALAPGDRRFSVAQRLVILSPVSPALLPSFMLIQLMANEFQAAIARKGTGTTVKGVSSRNFRDVPLRVPPLGEQQAIVECVEDQLSVIEHLEADLEAKMTRAHSLRQVILRHAFAGQLVPQNPNDEPASQLLKRTATQRDARVREATAAKRPKQSSGSRTGGRRRLKPTQTRDD